MAVNNRNDKAPAENNTASKEDEVIYDLVIKNTAAHQSSLEANLVEQVEKLCQEYESVNKKLEQSLLASEHLSKQLAHSKKSSSNSVALIVAGLSLLLGAGAILATMDMQRDIADLKTSLAVLTEQRVQEKQQTALKTKEIDGQIAQLTDRVDKVFTVDNMDNVLQITRELRNQINELANKNLSLMNAHNQLQKPKISLPSLNLPKEELQQDKKLSTNSLTDKDTAKKPQDVKLAAASNSANVDELNNWTVTFGTFKDKAFAKNTADKVKKAGIFVEIIQVHQKKQNLYRVVSKTFKTKQEAQNQAEQVEKTLGIHSAVLTKTR